jgi:hypothetical protein
MPERQMTDMFCKGSCCAVIHKKWMVEYMGKAYMGKIPNVDLTNGSIDEQIIPDEVYRSVTSGIGLAKTGSQKRGQVFHFDIPDLTNHFS